jgi:transcriptional regulator with XRE-family HTH domain
MSDQARRDWIAESRSPIYERRTQWGLSQRRLANLAGVSDATVSRAEDPTGSHNIGIQALVNICMVLRLPIEVAARPFLHWTDLTPDAMPEPPDAAEVEQASDRAHLGPEWKRWP